MRAGLRRAGAAFSGEDLTPLPLIAQASTFLQFSP